MGCWSYFPAYLTEGISIRDSLYQYPELTVEFLLLLIMITNSDNQSVSTASDRTS
jgi:hypothetical protein